MIQVNSLLEYFLGLKDKYPNDEELLCYYFSQIDKCKSLLSYGIEYTTFEQFEKLGV